LLTARVGRPDSNGLDSLGEDVRGKGKSDPIEAHLAGLAALRLDTGQLPAPRADGGTGH